MTAPTYPGRHAPRRGFQGSSSTTVRVVIYPAARRDQEPFELHGVDERSTSPGIVEARTWNTLDGCGGGWSLIVKAPGLRDFGRYLEAHQPASPGFAPWEETRANDWIDIAFIRQGKEFHVMRGLIDSIRQQYRVVNGAWSRTYVLQGRSFGKIFQITPLFFDTYTDGDFVGIAASQIAHDVENFVFGNPSDTVKGLLFGFIQKLRLRDRAAWLHPRLPGESVDLNFGVARDMYDDFMFTDSPARSSVIYPPTFNPGETSVWNLAYEWSDPLMQELFLDLSPASNWNRPETTFTQVGQVAYENFADPTGLKSSARKYSGRSFRDQEACPIGTTRATVFYRDRPFPTKHRRYLGEAQPIEQGPWFENAPQGSIAAHVVDVSAVLASDLTVSDELRKNAFFVQGRLLQDLGSSFLQFQVPKVHKAQILRHGLRRFDAATRYTASVNATDVKEREVLGVTERMRDILIEHHALDHELLTGQITLGPGRPDIRIGSRILIGEFMPDASGLSAYVEGVEHTWRRPEGLHTTLTVTRGWTARDGDYDESYLAYLDTVVSEYELPPRATYTPSPSAQNVPAGDWATGAERYAPYSSELTALLFEAATALGRSDALQLAENQALHRLIEKESNGYVGRPNVPSYGQVPPAYWAQIHAELREGIYSGRAVNARGQKSSATGLGQLILPNVDKYHPPQPGVDAHSGNPTLRAAKRAGIGQALPEAIGVLAYLFDRFPSPEAALAYHDANRSW